MVDAGILPAKRALTAPNPVLERALDGRTGNYVSYRATVYKVMIASPGDVASNSLSRPCRYLCLYWGSRGSFIDNP